MTASCRNTKFTLRQLSAGTGGIYLKVSIIAENSLDLLLRTLDGLKKAQLKRFRMYLSEKMVEGFEPIPKGRLEDSDATDVASMMKEFYGEEGRVKMTLTILRKMNLNNLADKLEERADHVSLDRIRPHLLRYACELTLDPNTPGKLISLSKGNRKVTYMSEVQSYPEHPERFDGFQVLCREGLTGCCYWEAEWSRAGAGIAVAYKSIKRKGLGDDVIMGWNAKSWSLNCSPESPDSYSVWHNKNRIDIPAPSSGSRRVGVYLDWPAGTLSYYSVSTDTLTHLHTFHSTFTEPLYPGFWTGFSVSLCQIT